MYIFSFFPRVYQFYQHRHQVDYWRDLNLRQNYVYRVVIHFILLLWVSTPSFYAIYFIQLHLLRWYGHHRRHLLHHSRHFFLPLRRSDSRVTEKTSDSIATPSSVTIHLFLSAIPYILYIFFAKSTITTITTILITIHIKLFPFFHDLAPIPSSFFYVTMALIMISEFILDHSLFYVLRVFIFIVAVM